MKKDNVSPYVIKRLPRYFRYLNELCAGGVTRISSKELSERMGITASQIRQDLNCFGVFGQQGYGYNIELLLGEIKSILGADRINKAIIIGAGNIGMALANNMKFEKRGVFITGLFDTDPQKIGKQVKNLTIRSMDELKLFCERDLPDIAVLTLPKEHTQETAQQLANYGVKGFWNFSNMELNIPDACVENMHMGDSLMLLCYSLKNKTDKE